MKRIKSPPDKGNQWGVLPSQKHQSSFRQFYQPRRARYYSRCRGTEYQRVVPDIKGARGPEWESGMGKLVYRGPRCESGVRDAAKSQKMTNREKSSSKWMIYICPTHKIPQRGRLHMKRFQDRPARAAVYPGRASFDRNVPVRQQRIVGEMI